MKKLILLFMLLFTTTVVCVSENLLHNGDFSDGISGWSGSNLSIQEYKNNRHLKLWLNEWDALQLCQTFPITGKFPSYHISLKYKTDNKYSGEGITVSVLPIKAPKETKRMQKKFTLEQTGEWTSLDWNINFDSSLTNCTQMKVNFQALPGYGRLYLDDIAITGSISRLEVIEPHPGSDPLKNSNRDSGSKPDSIQFETLPENRTDNLLRNGTFSAEDEHWRGAPERRWDFDSNEAVMEVRDSDYSEKKKNAGFIDQFNIINDQNCTTFYVRGKYKTSEAYTGKEFRPAVYCQSNQSIAKWKSVPISAAAEWTEFHCTIRFKKDLPDDYLRFAVFVRQGTGEIYFDDLELIGIPES